MLAVAKKAKRIRARNLGQVRLVAAELDPSLDDALEACALRDRRSKKAVISIALEEYLEKHSLWPPPEDVDEP